MALASGSSALASDYNAARSAVIALYQTTTGSSVPTIVQAVAGQTIIRGSDIDTLFSVYTTAVSNHVTTCSGKNVAYNGTCLYTSNTGNCSNDSGANTFNGKKNSR